MYVYAYTRRNYIVLINECLRVLMYIFIIISFIRYTMFIAKFLQRNFYKRNVYFFSIYSFRILDITINCFENLIERKEIDTNI